MVVSMLETVDATTLGTEVLLSGPGSCQKQPDVPRSTSKAVGSIQILPIKEDLNASHFQGNPS